MPFLKEKIRLLSANRVKLSGITHGVDCHIGSNPLCLRFSLREREAANLSDGVLRVTAEDVNEYSEFLPSILTGLLGLVAFLPISVGTGLLDSLIVFGRYAFTAAWAAFALFFAILILLRPRIIRRLVVGRDFKKVFSRYRASRVSFVILFYSLGIITLIILYLPVKQWTSLDLVLAGLTYLMMAPTITAQRVLKPNNEARLAILQFLRESSLGNPNYSWLRIGLRQIERNLPDKEILVINRNELFLGCVYRIFKGINVEVLLADLSQWILKPFQTSNSSITLLLRSASKARTLNLSPAPTAVDRLIDGVRNLPSWLPVGWISLVAVLLYLGVPSSVIDQLRRVIIP